MIYCKICFYSFSAQKAKINKIIMWSIFKNKTKEIDKEFIIRYKFGNLNYDTIVYAVNRQKAIEKFTKKDWFTSITSVVEV
jgi:hypothetical protein